MHMENDLLRELLTSIETWCQANEVALFHGNLGDVAGTEVTWDSSSDSDWEKYLACAKQSRTSIVVVSSLLNDIDTQSEEVVAYRDSLDDGDLEPFREAAMNLERRAGYVVYLKLAFFHEDVCYIYTHSSGWIDDYLWVEEAFREGEQDEEDDEDESTEGPDRPSKQEIVNYARTIAWSEAYIAAKNPIKRKEIVESMMEENGITDHVVLWALTRKAEGLFEVEVRPVEEEKIKRSVLALKAQGLKKVEIASKLNISGGMVNKFYYTED